MPLLAKRGKCSGGGAENRMKQCCKMELKVLIIRAKLSVEAEKFLHERNLVLTLLCGSKTPVLHEQES